MPGNVNCLEAQYQGTLEVTVELCGGRTATLRGISAERTAFANGRERTWGADMYYQLSYDGRNLSPAMSLNQGNNRHRQVSFPPQQVSHVVIGLISRRTFGAQIYQRLCSISVAVD